MSSEIVVTGAAAIGRMSWKKTRILLAPSTRAASSTSLEIPRKNCRRKKIANGRLMKIEGSAIPKIVSMSPSCLMSTKLGRKVKIAGIMSPPRKRAKTRSRHFHFSREKA